MREEWNLFLPGVCGLGLHFKLDGFRLVYLAIAVLMWGMSGLFSREYMAHYQNKRRYYLFFWATFAATAGVFLSADLYTTFIFFEIMSFTSYVWVAFDEKKESLKAAETYLAVAVTGGMVMLMGLFLLYHLLGTLEMDLMREAAEACGDIPGLYAAGGLLLFGFGAKAGCFPLHIWLPKAHPVAPAPASALLSGILTKTGVFGILAVTSQIFAGDANWGLMIAALGLATMFLGAFLALFSINLKRTLACSSVSQIGFILTGTGTSCLLKAMGANNSLAVRGTFLHMVNHSLFKLVLFLCAGAVFMNLHQLDLNEIRGFGRKKPVLRFCFLMGALGIGGIPLFSGYVSKTLLHEGLVEYRELAEGGAQAFVFLKSERISAILSNGTLWTAAEWLFLLTGGMTVAYMLKLYIALFVEKHPQKQDKFDNGGKPCMKAASALALIVPSVILPAAGLFPHVIMDGLADLGQEFFLGDIPEHAAAYFSWENLKGSLISIGIGIFLYAVLVRGCLMVREDKGEGKRYVDRWPAWLDLETLVYRPVMEKFLPGVCGAVCAFLDRYLLKTAVFVFMGLSAVVCRVMDQLADGMIRLARMTTHRQTDGSRPPVFKNGPLFELGRRIWRTGRLVEESFSFGLMLFCIGLCLTMGYLLAVFLL